LARIPDEDLQRLKAEVSLVGLVEAAGVTLRRAGADLVGCCPFHEDREPSLVVSPAKNLWHCLGACQAGGTVIDWVMRAEGVSFRHAVELLREGRAMSAPASRTAPARSRARKLVSPLERLVGDDELLGRVVSFYHDTLMSSPEALDYLRSRRVGDPVALDSFEVGYANRTLGYRLAAKRTVEGAELRGRLQALGVLRSSGHEHFNGSIVIPIFDAQGRVVEMYGRKIRDDLRAGTPKHLYLPGPHAGVWNRDGLVGGEVIVCESLIDALSLWCAGFRNVTAAYGTEGFTNEHLEAFVEAGVRRVLVAFDADPAGDRGAAALADTLGARGMEVWRVALPAGADVNEVACSAGDAAAKVLGGLLADALPMVSTLTASPPTPVGDDPVSSSAASRPAPVLASDVAEPPAGPAPTVSTSGETVLAFEDRRWRLRGLDRLSSFDLLRLNVLVGRGERFYIDTLDLYSARARAGFVKAAAVELAVGEEVVRADLAKVLVSAEAVADRVIAEAQAPKAPEPVVLSEGERTAAMGLLTDPGLVDRIVADFERAGMVGEATNCLVGYLVATSRLLERPLAVLVQSTSAAGKSALLDAVLAMVPAEGRVRYSAMTGQSLFYMGETDLAHRVLAISEEEGAERAAYALKLLQSEGELSIASTGKDPASGRLMTHTYRVAGPTAILLPTTSAEVDEELLNRCVVLSVDEDRAQTRAIHHRQRHAETLAGLLEDQARCRIVKVHQDAQRLLEPVLVVNPFAPRLTFADGQTRTRRDHVKYLTLIRAVTLLHQHQRPHQTAAGPDGEPVEFIETTVADIVVANRLAHEVLGRSLDELPPQTRRLLDLLDGLYTDRAAAEGKDRAELRLSRRHIREALGWGDTQLKVHLARLVDLELMAAQRAEEGGALVYRLAWDGHAGTDGGRFVIGLTDPASLTETPQIRVYDPDRSGPGGVRSGGGRPPVGPRSGPGRGSQGSEKPLGDHGSRTAEETGTPERAYGGDDQALVVVAGASANGRAAR
jgi:DNA primase